MLEFIKTNQPRQSDFTYARFVISMATEASKDVFGIQEDLRCLSRFLESMGSLTAVERKEQYSMLVSYEEAKWLCNYFWKSFVDLTNTKVDNLDAVDYGQCLSFVSILDDAARYGAIASFMVETDLQACQTADIFN